MNTQVRSSFLRNSSSCVMSVDSKAVPFKPNSKVELRDDEIKRLNFALKGGRPHDVISLEAQNISNEKCIAHLNLQASTSGA